MVVHKLKGLPVKQAIKQLEVDKKRPAIPVKQTLKRIKAAFEHNHEVDPERLEIVRTWIGKGLYFKDTRLHARGKRGRIHHPSAHVKLEVRYIPTEIEFNADKLPVRSDFEKIWDRLRRNKLLHPFPEKKRILFHRTPWNALKFKYLEKPNWTNPKYPVREM